MRVEDEVGSGGAACPEHQEARPHKRRQNPRAAAVAGLPPPPRRARRAFSTSRISCSRRWCQISISLKWYIACASFARALEFVLSKAADRGADIGRRTTLLSRTLVLFTLLPGRGLLGIPHAALCIDSASRLPHDRSWTPRLSGRPQHFVVPYRYALGYIRSYPLPMEDPFEQRRSGCVYVSELLRYGLANSTCSAPPSVSRARNLSSRCLQFRDVDHYHGGPTSHFS